MGVCLSGWDAGDIRDSHVVFVPILGNSVCLLETLGQLGHDVVFVSYLVNIACLLGTLGQLGHAICKCCLLAWDIGTNTVRLLGTLGQLGHGESFFDFEVGG